MEISRERHDATKGDETRAIREKGTALVLTLPLNRFNMGLIKFLSPSLIVLLLVWESVSPFLPLFQSHGDRARHFSIALAWTLTNRVLTSILFAKAFVWASSFRIGLFDAILPKGFPILRSIVTIVVFDLWTYLWHFLNHTVPFLWQFHRLHHNDKQMDVTTATRFHIGEIQMSNLLRIPLLILLGIRLDDLVIYETLLVSTILVHHANIDIGVAERILRRFWATPGLHKVHHSILPHEYNSNYGSFMSIWDQLFGTYVTNNNLKAIQFGVR